MTQHDYPEAKGRGKRSFVALYHDVVESPSWHDLSGDAVKLLIGIAAGYKGPMTGPLVCSVRQAQAIVRCGLNKPKRLFTELEQHGFLEVAFRSSFSVKCRRASEWYLTWLKHENHPPTNLWRRWTPGKKRSRFPKSTVTISVAGTSDSHQNSDRTVTNSVNNGHENGDTLYSTRGCGETIRDKDADDRAVLSCSNTSTLKAKTADPEFEATLDWVINEAPARRLECLSDQIVSRQVPRGRGTRAQHLSAVEALVQEQYPLAVAENAVSTALMRLYKSRSRTGEVTA